MTYKLEYRVGVQATSDQAWEVLAELSRWGQWSGLYPAMEGVIRKGATLTAQESIEGLPGRRITPVVADWVPRAQLLWAERRGWLAQSVRYFEIEELRPGACIISNGEQFQGLRGQRWGRAHRRSLRVAFAAFGDAWKGETERAFQNG